MSFCKFWDCEDNILRYILFFVLECSPSQSPPNVSLVWFFFHCILVSPASSTLTRSTAIFYSCWFFSCFYFSRYFSALLLACVLVVPTLCAWRFKRNSRKYSGFYLSGCAFCCCMLFLTATICFCCNFVSHGFCFSPDTSILLLFMGDCLVGNNSVLVELHKKYIHRIQAHIKTPLLVTETTTSAQLTNSPMCLFRDNHNKWSMFANIGIYLVVYLTSNTISCSYEMQILVSNIINQISNWN